MNVTKMQKWPCFVEHAGAQQVLMGIKQVRAHKRAGDHINECQADQI